ncbi:MAG TPA: hypothetical protein VK045_03655 [Ornithinicoccus sp.]|nr:hypothetical protein [Ornithinicoccus sp.]
MAYGDTKSGPSKALGATAALLALVGLVLLGLGLYGVLNTATPNMTGINPGQSVRIHASGMSLWAEQDVREDTVCQIGDTTMERPTSAYSVNVGDREFFEVARTPADMDPGSYPVTCEGTEAALYVGPNATRTTAPGIVGNLGLVLGGILLAVAAVLGLGALLTRQKRVDDQPYQYSSYAQPGQAQSPYAPPGYGPQAGYGDQPYPPPPGYGAYGPQDQTQGYSQQGYGHDQTQAYGQYGQGPYAEQQGQGYGQYGQGPYGQDPYGQGHYGQQGPYAEQQGQGYGQYDQGQGSQGYGQYGEQYGAGGYGATDQTQSFEQQGQDQPQRGSGATAWQPGQELPGATPKSPYSDIPPPPGYGPPSTASDDAQPDESEDSERPYEQDDDDQTQQFPPPPRWDDRG